jgi:methionine-S-sulfoxide reductase
MAWRGVLVACLALALVGGCRSGPEMSEGDAGAPEEKPASQPASSPSETTPEGTRRAEPPAPGLEAATFAGGCFWCMEPPFEKLPGVKAVLSGYTGGPEQAPTYKQVSAGDTGHTEAVHVIFDPKIVGYPTLVEVYWRSMDPTDAGGQFADRGTQYRPAIFFHSDAQKAQAEASKKALLESKRFGDKEIAVPIQPAGAFWVAEDYHQDFYKTNEAHYKRYSVGSGRVGFLQDTWKDAAPLQIAPAPAP